MIIDLRVNTKSKEGPSWKGQIKEGPSWKGQIIKKEPAGRIQWKSRADTRLVQSQNIKRIIEAYAYEY